MTKKELTFKEGYEILKKNAELLESQKEPDIDNLMKIVEESMSLLTKPVNHVWMQCNRL